MKQRSGFTWIEVVVVVVIIVILASLLLPAFYSVRERHQRLAEADPVGAKLADLQASWQSHLPHGASVVEPFGYYWVIYKLEVFGEIRYYKFYYMSGNTAVTEIRGPKPEASDE